MRTDVLRASSAPSSSHTASPASSTVWHLRGAGDRGLPTLEIAERMIESTPGTTRLIDRLETKKLVSRERCLTDRRQVFCASRIRLSLLPRSTPHDRSRDNASAF